jgi:hypothetical protein
MLLFLKDIVIERQVPSATADRCKARGGRQQARRNVKEFSGLSQRKLRLFVAAESGTNTLDDESV